MSKLECGFYFMINTKTAATPGSGDHTDLKDPLARDFQFAMISEDKLVINKSGPPTSECRKGKRKMHK